MSKFNVEINKDGDLVFAVDNLLTDAVCRRLVKLAIFEPLAMEGISKMLIHGVIEWDDDDGYEPWWMTWSGAGDSYERARKQFLGLAPEVTQTLVAQLTDERDKLRKERDELRQEKWHSDRLIHDLQAAVLQLRDSQAVSP